MVTSNLQPVFGWRNHWLRSYVILNQTIWRIVIFRITTLSSIQIGLPLSSLTLRICFLLTCHVQFRIFPMGLLVIELDGLQSRDFGDLTVIVLRSQFSAQRLFLGKILKYANTRRVTHPFSVKRR